MVVWLTYQLWFFNAVPNWLPSKAVKPALVATQCLPDSA
jgi:hypothetical protein